MGVIEDYNSIALNETKNQNIKQFIQEFKKNHSGFKFAQIRRLSYLEDFLKQFIPLIKCWKKGEFAFDESNIKIYSGSKTYCHEEKNYKDEWDLTIYNIDRISYGKIMLKNNIYIYCGTGFIHYDEKYNNNVKGFDKIKSFFVGNNENDYYRQEFELQVKDIEKYLYGLQEYIVLSLESGETGKKVIIFKDGLCYPLDRASCLGQSGTLKYKEDFSQYYDNVLKQIYKLNNS